MHRIALTSILLLALTTACASTEEPAPEPEPVTQAAAPPPPAPVPAALDDSADDEPVAMLPDTASSAPAIGLAGGLAIALAGALGVVRRRLR